MNGRCCGNDNDKDDDDDEDEDDEEDELDDDVSKFSMEKFDFLLVFNAAVVLQLPAELLDVNLSK